MGAFKYEVGQEVIVRTHSPRRPDKTAVVTRVGRKYFYVHDGWGETAFDADTGWERSTHYTSRVRAFPSASARDEHDRREALLADLHEKVRGFGWTHPLSTADIQQILAILDKEPK